VDRAQRLDRATHADTSAGPCIPAQAIRAYSIVRHWTILNSRLRLVATRVPQLVCPFGTGNLLADWRATRRPAALD